MNLETLKREYILRYFYEENMGPYLAFQRSAYSSKLKAGCAIAQQLLGYFSDKTRHLRILDIGCGGGEQTNYLLKHLVSLIPNLNIHYVATDPSAKMLNHAKRLLCDFPPNFHIMFKQFGVHSAPSFRVSDVFGSEQFHFALASFVMFHIDDWNDALDQFLECLTPSGVLCVVLESWAHSDNGNGNQFRRGLFEIVNNNLQNRFTSEDFERLLREREVKYMSRVVPSIINLGQNYHKGINKTIEFMLNYPRWALSAKQKMAIMNVIRSSSIVSGILESWQKLIWIRKG